MLDRFCGSWIDKDRHTGHLRSGTGVWGQQRSYPQKRKEGKEEGRKEKKKMKKKKTMLRILNSNYDGQMELLLLLIIIIIALAAAAAKDQAL